MGYNRRGFFLLWDATEKNLRMANKFFFLLYPTMQEFFFRCILHHNRILCVVLYPRKIFRVVSHNAAGFLLLYPTMEDIFLRCEIQQKRFISVAGFNRRGFPPLWDITGEVFSIVGYNGRVFSFVGYCSGQKMPDS